jgi:hypothetical protein
MEWHEVVVSILSGLAIAIPLVVELVKWVKKAVEEKNWQELLKLVTNLMTEAESKFQNGADRKEWVLTCVKASADTINYKIDLEQVGNLVDSLCAMSKIVNAPKEEETEVKE